MALIVLLVTAFAGTRKPNASGGLPEIAAADDTAVEALPDVIAAE